MNLYDINREIENCFLIDEETGELTVDESKLKLLELKRDEKVENIACWIKNLRADVDGFKTEIDRLQARREQTKNKIDRLSNYLENALNGNKFKTPKVSISYRSSKAVNIIDSSKIDMKYKEYSEPKISKTAIKKAMENGEKVDGAVLEFRTSMIIK